VEAPSQRNLTELLILFSRNEKQLTVEVMVSMLFSTCKQTKQKKEQTEQGDKQGLVYYKAFIL
jgi:hypothetical protein